MTFASPCGPFISPRDRSSFFELEPGTAATKLVVSEDMLR